MPVKREVPMTYMEHVAQFRDRMATRGFNVDEDGSVSCDSCAVMAINGIHCHEQGCPNMTHECAGCNAQVPMNVKYCEECR